jgi:hypothetical protein
MGAVDLMAFVNSKSMPVSSRRDAQKGNLDDKGEGLVERAQI